MFVDGARVELKQNKKRRNRNNVLGDEVKRLP